MNKATARKIQMGDYVIQAGNNEPQRVNSVKVRGMVAPYFRLEGDNGDLASYSICRPHSRDGMLWSETLQMYVSIPND